MILNHQRRVPVAVKPLEQFLREVQKTLRLEDRDVTVCLVRDAAIAHFNRAFRGKLGPTDVLSFPADDNGAAPRPQAKNSIQRPQKPQRAQSTQKRQRSQRTQREGGQRVPRSSRSSTSSPSSPSSPSSISSPSYLGDIAISPESARRNARRFARPLSLELRILILHGILHLLGYDHETDRGEMERLERRLRRRLGVS